MKGTRKPNFLLTFGSGGGGSALAPSLPTTNLVGNWDVSKLTSLQFRSGSSIGVKGITNQVTSGLGDMTELTDYGEQGYDPQYVSIDKSIDLADTAPNGFKIGPAGGILTLPYTIVIVMQLTSLATTTGIIDQGYSSYHNVLRFDPGIGLFSSDGHYGYTYSNQAICSITPIANKITLMYISRDADNNNTIFMNNQTGVGTSTATATVYAGQFRNYSYDDIRVLKTHQLLIYNGILSDKDKTSLLGYLNTKWKIW